MSARELNGEGFLLRPWRKGDESSLVRYANNRKVSIHLRDRFPFPYTLNDALQWIDFAGQSLPPLNFAIEIEGEAAGGIGLLLGEDIHRRTAELGYWLGEPFWGRGIATEAVRLMTEYGFRELPLVRIFAAVLEWNPASARVLEKAGFTLESRVRSGAFKEGRVLDEWVYVRLKERDPGESSPTE